MYSLYKNKKNLEITHHSTSQIKPLLAYEFPERFQAYTQVEILLVCTSSG